MTKEELKELKELKELIHTMEYTAKEATKGDWGVDEIDKDGLVGKHDKNDFERFYAVRAINVDHPNWYVALSDYKFDSDHIIASNPQNVLELIDYTRELSSALASWTEYFGAIKNGHLENNRRTTPLREVEHIFLTKSRDLLGWDNDD